MKNLSHSKPAAWGAMILIVLVIAFSFSTRTVWWAFFDIFFAFMAGFCWLVGVYINKYNRNAYRKLLNFAAVFGILFVLAFITEFILAQVILG